MPSLREGFILYSGAVMSDIKTHELDMVNNRELPFLQYMERGIKKAEGRVATPQVRGMKIGDRLYLKGVTEYGIFEITYLHFYPGFSEMLDGEGLKTMVPFVDSKEKALEIYMSFPGAEEVFEYGCCAIGIKHIETKLDFTVDDLS